jgi:two-component system sensor histidine kinase/response regulator
MDDLLINPSIDLKGRRILVVDDDRVNLRIIGGILRHEGYVISEAVSGEQALEVYAEFRPNLVLLDVMMPGIDGFETCRILRKTYGDTGAPVIFVTAKSEAEDIVMGFDAGGVDYLTKPFRPKEVLARIRTHLSNQLLVEQLSKANAAKDRFLGMCAHDLRNPLSSIRGLAELMNENAIGILTAEQREIVHTIHGASQSMLQLVNELLDVATIEAGHLKLAKEPTKVADIVERSVHLSNIEAAKKNTRIEMVNGTKDPLIDVDRNKIRQVVDNLINNAVKYSPRGSLITVEVRAEEATAGFAVKDNGPGIPDGERHKLFKDYGRLTAQPTGGEKSTGLGLAICRNIVEAHGGTISVENIPGRGCEFVVRLPRSK